MYFYDLEEIKNRMKEKEISTKELAESINISRTAIFYILKGDTDFNEMKLGTYKKIVNFLWK